MVTRSPQPQGVPSKRPPKGFLATKAGAVVLLAALGAVIYGANRLATRIDEYRFPWGYPRPGRPALAGTWVGTLVTGGGVRRGVLLDLRLAALGEGRRRGRMVRDRRRDPMLRGTMAMCGNPLGEQRFTLHGAPEDGAATRIRLSLYPADSLPPDGLAPSHLRGRWDERDSLAFEADVHLRRGQSAISSTDDPDTGRPARIAAMRGGDAEFRALCSRIARRG